jgi:thiol:disulfide interchange protein DsbC
MCFVLMLALLVSCDSNGGDSATSQPVQQASEPQVAAVTSSQGNWQSGAQLAGGELSAFSELFQKKLDAIRSMGKVSTVLYGPFPGVYEVYMDSGAILFASADGSHVVDASTYRLEPGEFVDIQEERLRPQRAKLLGEIPEEEMIIFSPQGKTEAVAYIFTDIDCGYCQKLHREMREINSYGIEIRYLAFPRAGIDSNSAKKLEAAWCAEDRQDAMTRLKNRQEIPMLSCENPVASQYELGNLLRVRGTPAIFRADGSTIPGYRPAAQLASDLGLAVSEDPAQKTPVN